MYMNEYELNKELLHRGYVCDKVFNNAFRYYSKFRDHFIIIQKSNKYNKLIVKNMIGDSWTTT